MIAIWQFFSFYSLLKEHEPTSIHRKRLLWLADVRAIASHHAMTKSSGCIK
jgi:hypothetical protein